MGTFINMPTAEKSKQFSELLNRTGYHRVAIVTYCIVSRNLLGTVLRLRCTTSSHHMRKCPLIRYCTLAKRLFLSTCQLFH